jgi:Domain of unknown function (DUF5655)
VSTFQPPNALPLGRLGDVTRWACPHCGREFGSANQAHTCVPGITVDELLARHPAWVADIYTAVIDRLRRLGPIYEDAVNVGVFLKSDRKIAEVRPRVRSVQLLLYLPERVDDPQIARVLATGSDRILHVINLTSPEQVDDQLGQWLELSYDFNTDGVRPEK